MSDQENQPQSLSGESRSPEKPLPDPDPPVVTSHELILENETHAYQATFGKLPIRNGSSEIEATLSFASYTLGEEPHGDPNRPLTILFNGGPGSASVWLHLGGLGPRRVKMLDDGGMPAPPFEIVNNELSWLPFTDLLFIDPVETGYSKAASTDLTEKFCTVDGDLDLVGEFIRLYLSRYNRWASPLFVGGESYGTFRAAGLAGKVAEKGIIFNGIILISSVLDLGTLLFESGDDLPFVCYFPSFAATAWFHNALGPDHQHKPLESFLSEVEAWTRDVYAPALMLGHTLSLDKQQGIAAQMSSYTGLPADRLIDWNLRITGGRFCNELLRPTRRIVGRLDSRHTGFDPAASTDNLAFDPSMSAIRAPFTAAFNSYVRSELGYHTDDEYQILRGIPWKWGDGRDGAPRTTFGLQDAFARNPYLQLLVLSGYFDLATPYFATRYTLDRLTVDPEVRSAIQTRHYPSGHMLYIDIEMMKQSRDDVRAFIEGTLAMPGKPLRPGFEE